MKQGTVIVRIIIWVFFLGVLAYFGVYAWEALTDNTSTATLYSHTAEARIESTGWFFRDEVILEESTLRVEVLCAEGERVGKGDAVVRLYANEQGYELQQELDDARSTLAGLQYILSRTGSSADSVALDEDIVDTFTALRLAASDGELTQLSEEADELRSLIFRRDYTYNGTDALTHQIDQVEQRIEALTQQTSGVYEAVKAPAAGLYSARVDGYESLCALSALEGLTPADLDKLEEGGGRVGNSVGKIVTSSGWYFACTLTQEQMRSLYGANRVTLRFSDSSREFTAEIYSVSQEQEGRFAVVFTSDAYAAQVTGLRRQNVDIIIGSATGFRVPKRAVRVAEDGTLGVYRVSGAQAQWVAIDILWEEEDYYLIAQAPKTDENGKELEMSAFEKASRLRVGDSVIVKGEGIYDGKVVGE